jgi:hypothetical protein
MLAITHLSWFLLVTPSGKGLCVWHRDPSRAETSSYPARRILFWIWWKEWELSHRTKAFSLQVTCALTTSHGGGVSLRSRLASPAPPRLVLSIPPPLYAVSLGTCSEGSARSGEHNVVFPRKTVFGNPVPEATCSEGSANLKSGKNKGRLRCWEKQIHSGKSVPEYVDHIFLT